jgi:hypothetical protein
MGVVADKNIAVVSHPAYSSDLAPCNLSYFTITKSQLREPRFQPAPERQEQLAVLHAIPKSVQAVLPPVAETSDPLHKLERRQGTVTTVRVYFVIDSVRKRLNTPWRFIRYVLRYNGKPTSPSYRIAHILLVSYNMPIITLWIELWSLPVLPYSVNASTFSSDIL